MKLQNYIRIISLYLSLSLRGCKSHEQSFKNNEYSSPLEQKVDELNEVVERLLVELRANEIKIHDLESKAEDFKTEMESKVKDMKTLLELNTQNILYLEKRVLKLQQINAMDSVINSNSNKTHESYFQLQHQADVTGANTDKIRDLSNSPKERRAKRTNAYRHIIHKRVPELQPAKIAFHIVLTSNEPVVANKVVTFQNTIIDTCNAYSSGDGIYIVPITGIYVFTWTITGRGHTIASTELMINKDTVLRTIADSDENNDFHTSTGITVSNVKQGDHVYVKFAPSFIQGTIEQHYGQTSFSGWKLD